MYHIETYFLGKWSWLDSFDTLDWAVTVAMYKGCNWRVIHNGHIVGRSI